MADRRPHWDDELIEAVRWKAECDRDEAGMGRVYTIIAAVEDWHKDKRDARVRTHSAECWRWHQECAEYRIEKLSAQVQAVRDVCKTYHLDDSYPNRRKVVFLDRILRALDGNVIGVRQDETNNKE